MIEFQILHFTLSSIRQTQDDLFEPETFRAEGLSTPERVILIFDIYILI